MKTPQVFSPIQFCEKKNPHGKNPAGNFVIALEASNDDKLSNLHSVLFVLMQWKKKAVFKKQKQKTHRVFPHFKLWGENPTGKNHAGIIVFALLVSNDV